jgi:hypothetical protein
MSMFRLVRSRESFGVPRHPKRLTGTHLAKHLRIEARPLAKIAAQGQAGNGMEAADVLRGITKPAWYGVVSWRDHDEEVIWRADEVELVTAPPVQRGPLRGDVSISDAWWTALNASLDALASQLTTRVATPDTEAITQALVTREIERAFPGQVDTTIREGWTPAHADLNWSNLTGQSGADTSCRHSMDTKVPAA